MLRKLAMAVLVMTLTVAAAGVSLAREDVPQFIAIDTAESEGLIDAEQALLYRFMYVFDQEKLPAQYYAADTTPLKCATPLLKEYDNLRSSFSANVVLTIDEYLRPSAIAKAGYVSPGGNFEFTYSTTGPNAVPAADTNPVNGVPDFVERCAEYMDESWLVEITNLGFAAPSLAPYYDISFEEMGAYGYTTVISGGRTKIVLENDFAGFPPNTDPDGIVLGAAKVTCAHEFKHASQYVASGWSEGGWVELDATWAEDLVYDDTNDYYNYLTGGSGISSPQTSLDGGGTGSYEDCIWQIWMTETYGNQIVVDLWNYRTTHQAESMLASYNAILGQYGSSMAAGFVEFAAWNYATGANAITGIGYSEAAAYNTSFSFSAAAYPYANSGTLDHLASTPIKCTGFTPGEPGSLRLQFDGDLTTTMGLVAVIEKNDGTGVYEPLTLDFNQDFDGTLSVPLADIAQVGIVISNADSFNSNKMWSLTVTKDLPAPSVTLSAANVALALNPDTTGDQNVTLGNNGVAGSVLDYTAYIMADAPVAKKLVASTGTYAAARALPELQESELMSTSRYVGDCVMGNDNTGSIQGYYSTWWEGNETYAMRINPADYSCSCNPGFNVRAIHMLLYLEPTSNPSLRVHLASAGALCTTPGAIIDTSPSVSVSGIAANGYYDIEVPADFTCSDMSAEYFLIVEFLDANGPVGLPIDSAPLSCVYYNDYGGGYEDVVASAGFVGGLMMWADTDCCGTAAPDASVLSPNGGEVVAVGNTLDLTWTATVMTEVKIELSRDGGGIWETLLAVTPNDGAETVTVTGPASENCLLRVGSTDGVTTDISNGPFWIYSPVAWVAVAPQSGQIAAGADQLLTLSFDSTGLAPGDFTGYLVVVDNATSSPEVVPVTLTVNDVLSGVGDAPRRFALQNNVPNPFNPSTTVYFSLAQTGQTNISVIDLRGRLVRTLHNGVMAAGERTVVWNGQDNAGRSVASGTYFVRLVSGVETATRKMVLAK